VIGRLRAALREYNAGRFFECHEALEDLLDETDREDWDFILGLIQVAVGYHKLTQHHLGGEKLLAMGLEKLAPYANDHGGLDLEQLRRGVRADLARRAAAQARGEPVPAPEPPQLLPVRNDR
jgi:predicted metal-dependent hydrolase